MKNTLLFISLLIAALHANTSLAQSSRSLSGILTLDVNPSNVDRTLLLTVRNHAFVVLPTFAISRPIISSRSVTVQLLKDRSSVNYSIDNILTDPVDYSIEIDCLSCTDDFPLQYYAPNGNSLALTNSIYIDPEDLPTVLNITAITRAHISGEVMLDRISDENLTFTLSVLSAKNPALVFQTRSPIVLPVGQRSVLYSVSGLRRAIGSDRFRVQLQCISCVGPSRRPQTFSQLLSPNENHTDIDFIATDEPFISITPILNLLLE